MAAEKSIEMYLRRAVKDMGGLAVKFPAMYISGFPDRAVFMPGGKIYFVELKSPKKRPTPLQEAVHNNLRKLGFKVFVFDDRKQIRQFLDELDVL